MEIYTLSLLAVKDEAVGLLTELDRGDSLIELMADDDYSSQRGNRNWIYVALFFIALVLLVVFAGGFYINQNKIAKENSQKIAQNSISPTPTATPVKDISDPAMRLALIRSYALALNPLLNIARQKDLETIMTYVTKNPETLVTKNPDLPKEVALAVTNLKAADKNLKVSGAMIKQDTSNVSYKQGDLFNLTGIINFVDSDDELGGGIFSLKDAESGDMYYLHFNDLNSTSIKANMMGKEVIIGVKVTSKPGEALVFQITKGPTLTASITYAPKKTATSAATPTP